MYRNAYSQGIADRVLQNDMRYLSHLEDEYMNIEGSGRHGNASKCACMEMPCRCSDEEMCGGSGFAAGTARDLGFESTIGAGCGKGSKTYRKRGCGQIAALPPLENLGELEGAGFVKDQAYLPKEAKTLERKVGGRAKKPKCASCKRVKCKCGAGKSGGGTKEFTDDVGKFDFNRIKDWIGLGKPSDMKKTTVEIQRMPLKNKDKVVEKAQMQSVIGGGKSGGVKQVKRKEKEVPVPMELLPINLQPDRVLDSERAKYVKTGPSKFTYPKQKGEGKSGGDGRKRRAEIVKKVMAEKGLKMIEASKYVKQHGLYK
jgi:hypothetical protein